MSKAKGMIPVSERALVQRINRMLEKDGEKMKATRSDKWRDEQGDWYIIDLSMNAIVAKHVDIESYGRKLGVLEPWERLEVE